MESCCCKVYSDHSTTSSSLNNQKSWNVSICLGRRLRWCVSWFSCLLFRIFQPEKVRATDRASQHLDGEKKQQNYPCKQNNSTPWCTADGSDNPASQLIQILYIYNLYNLVSNWCIYHINWLAGCFSFTISTNHLTPRLWTKPSARDLLHVRFFDDNKNI